MYHSKHSIHTKFRFFQTLMKNTNYEEILERIPQEKKINFYARNYETFLETQEELFSLKLPELKNIPEAREFHLKLREEEELEENQEEASVIEIVDSFSANVFEKNEEEVERLYKIIQEMKKHSKYKEYFYKYSINKILREAYVSFIENCKSVEKLLKLGEYTVAIKLFHEEKTTEIFEKINTDLLADSSMYSIKKSLLFLLNEIESYTHTFKVKFRPYIAEQPELTVFLSKWISDCSKQYYQSVEGFIYQQEEISEILKTLSVILETSRELETKGISLYGDIKNTISVDLPNHLEKIIEVIMESFDRIFKYSNELYEFVEIECKNHQSMSLLLSELRPITQKDYGKKCASKKGILLVNSFLVILEPLCEEKWAFLHENILEKLIDKVKTLLEEDKIKLSYWDYYHLFVFFYQLSTQGKIKNNELFSLKEHNNSVPVYLKDKILKVKRLSEECRIMFENKLINTFWLEVLSEIPELLWDFKKYAETVLPSEESGRTTTINRRLKPTIFSIALIFLLENFFKQIEFRLSKEHFEYLAIQLYEYMIYVIEYVIFWKYHDHAKIEKIFMLFKKQERYLSKAKEFNIDELPYIKQEKYLKISHFTKAGLEIFVVDFYFITEAYKIQTKLTNKEKPVVEGDKEKKPSSSPIKADDFLYKVSRILSKELKNEPLETDQSKYTELLKQFIGVYEKQPELMRKYLNDKRLGSGSESRSITGMSGTSSYDSSKKR